MTLKNKKQGFATILGITLIIVILGAGAYWYIESQDNVDHLPILPTPEEQIENNDSDDVEIGGGEEEPPQMTACTQEAKQCPDGSYVGRTGPNCEFEACQGE